MEAQKKGVNVKSTMEWILSMLVAIVVGCVTVLWHMEQRICRIELMIAKINTKNAVHDGRIDSMVTVAKDRDGGVFENRDGVSEYRDGVSENCDNGVSEDRIGDASEDHDGDASEDCDGVSDDSDEDIPPTSNLY